jgi:hypothetical protein
MKVNCTYDEMKQIKVTIYKMMFVIELDLFNLTFEKVFFL